MKKLYDDAYDLLITHKRKIINRVSADITGKIFGGFKVLGRDTSKFSYRTSYWFAECLNCGDISSTKRRSIMKNVTGCVKCYMTDRKYSITQCLDCGCELQNKINSTRVRCKVCHRKHKIHMELDNRRLSIENLLRRLCSGSKSRARRKGLDFNLDYDYLLDLLKHQKYKCARTGWDLGRSQPSSEKARSNRYTLSLDRVDNNKGYIKGNIELVCYQYNTMKNAFSSEEIEEACRDILKTAEMRRQRTGLTS